MSNRTICAMHRDGVERLRHARRHWKEARSEMETKSGIAALDYLDSALDSIGHIINDMHEAGERMERRLADYRSAIEGLGFERRKR